MFEFSKKPSGPMRSSDRPKTENRVYSSQTKKPFKTLEPKATAPISGPKSIKVRYRDTMLFSDGWFVLIEEDGAVSVMQREDAREIEREYIRYCDRRSCEYEPRESSIPAYEKMWREGTYTYKVDALANPWEDKKIGDKLVIPEVIAGHRVTRIYPSTFMYLEIKELVLPDSIQTVCREAFGGCYYLEKLTIGPNTQVASSAFAECPAIRFADGMSILGTTLFKANDEIAADLVIPSYITHISAEAFAGNSKLRSVVLPPNLISLGTDAFRGCKNLESVEFTGEGHNIDFGWGYIFRDCPKLERVQLPEGISQIGDRMFENCTSLKTVNIPKSVKNVTPTAFSKTPILETFRNSTETYLYLDNWLIKAKAERIKDPEIREGTYGIAYVAFALNKDGDMGSIVLPDSVKIVCGAAFKNTNAKNIHLGSVEFIGSEAFYGTDITEIHIPETCRYIGMRSLSSPNLMDVYFHGRDTEIDGPKPTRFADGRIARIHGYKGSTAEQYVLQRGQNLGLEFIEM